MTRFSILGISSLLLFLSLNSIGEAYRKYDPSNGNLEIFAGKCEDFDRKISLNFSGAGFSSLGDRFVDSPDVSCLDLSRNPINDISIDAFAGLPNLLYLNLAEMNNPVSNCEQVLLSIRNLKNLKTLVLDNSCNNDEMGPPMPYFSRHTVSLENLYLRRNDLRRIDLFGSLPGLSRLIGVYLSYNRLGADLYISWGDLPKSVNHLHLDNNELRQFQCERLSNITHLALNDNPLKTLCFRFGGYCGLSLQGAPLLVFLNLSSSQVTDIDSDTFDNCSRLTTLDLSHNSIRSIKKNTFDYTSLLEELYLEGNALETVPDLSKATNLRMLSLGSNNIHHLSEDSLSDLCMLKKLSLSNNSITSIDGKAFEKLTILEYLDLANNELLMLPNGWMPADNSLRVLNVQGNSIDNIESLALDFGYNLTDIYLQGNLLTSLNTNTLMNLPNNVSIHLGPECKREKVECKCNNGYY